MADSRDITGKNKKFTGLAGIKLPTGTTAQRVDETARLRFNSNTNLAEYYDGTSRKPIDSPPSITGVTPTSWNSDGATRQTFTVSGSNLQSGATAKFIGNDGTEYTGVNLSVTNSTTFTMQNTTSMMVANEPYDIVFTNPSGLAATIEDAIDAGATPSFTTAANTNLGSTSGGAVNPSLTTAAATDADGHTVTHTISAGSLPGGLSMATNGAITGTVSAVGSSTNYTFTVNATDGINAVTRQFVITVTPPAFMTATGGTITTNGDYKVHTFTSSGTFTVSALGGDSTYGSKVEYLVVAGGAGGGHGGHGGGGGAGGYRHNSAYNFTVAAQGYSITVGAYGNNRANGSTSTFSNITSAGGGSGGHNGSNTGRNGGSGGGGAGHQGSNKAGGSGNTPSVSPSQGSNGGSGQDGSPSYGSGGGGGASSAGQNGTSSNSPGGGNGGNGSANDIHGSSRTYSAGGGGHGHGNPGAGGSGGLGGNDNSAAGGRNTSNNYGMGGGGLNNNASSGVVVIRYKFQ